MVPFEALVAGVAVAEAAIPFGCVTVTQANVVQPFALVTVTQYCSGIKPEMVNGSVKELPLLNPVFQVYGAPPPVTSTVILPLLPRRLPAQQWRSLLMEQVWPE